LLEDEVSGAKASIIGSTVKGNSGHFSSLKRGSSIHQKE
jgi:hypothetical protein